MLSMPAGAVFWRLALADPTSVSISSDIPSFILQLTQYGLLGILLIDLIGTHKLLIPKWVFDGERQAAETAVAVAKAQYEAVIALKDQQIADQRRDLQELKLAQNELQKQMQDRYIPALVQVTEIAKDYLEELRRRGREDAAG